MSKASITAAPKLPLPAWYDRKLICNPWWQPNQEAIMAEAYRIAAECGVKKAGKDNPRIFRLRVDEQPDFTWPTTEVDPDTGAVTRYIPGIFEDKVSVPDWWTTGNNRLVWAGADYNPAALKSIHGGRLSVAGAWDCTQREVEWDMRNAAAITLYGHTMDSHGLTSRFDMHYYVARKNNPFGLPAGSHPTPFLDPPDSPFPVITPKNLYHPKHNPDGWWQPITREEKWMDETWEYVNKLGFVVLWTKHCNRYTGGQALDPVVMASTMHHNYMRGLLECEPLWFPKGMSWRSEFYGVFGPEVVFPDDQNAQMTLTMLQIFDGFPEWDIPPFDMIVASGQAKSHCVLRSIQQGVDHMIATGRAETVKKVYYLIDTSESIIGFEEATEKALADLAAKGVQLVTTEELALAA